MDQLKKIHTALVSVYHKKGLDLLARQFVRFGITAYSTGGTADYLREFGVEVIDVSDLTGYPSILGGRVKTLHPKIHGGILARRELPQDQEELAQYQIPEIDAVIIDLYPFSETVRSRADEEEIIEKIDIGGIALIRAAAKNFQDVAVVASSTGYASFTQRLETQSGALSLEQRRELAFLAFHTSSTYDLAIRNYLAPTDDWLRSLDFSSASTLRYGENPHQQALFFGDLSSIFDQIQGKELSFNNLVDIDGALQLVDEFDDPCFAIIKHTNACGCALGNDLLQAWEKALAGDPISAFGGVIACNGSIDQKLAEAIHPLFFEVLIAHDFSEEALQILGQKKNRILLRRKQPYTNDVQIKSVLGGILIQESNHACLDWEMAEIKTQRKPSPQEMGDMEFGEKVCKHLKSNAIAIVKDKMLIGAGLGQTSRIDAVKQALHKVEAMGFDCKGAVLVSDAFFPFSDAVQTAYEAGIELFIEPGGSLRDQDTIDFCEEKGLCLIFTGLRHFKH